MSIFIFISLHGMKPFLCKRPSLHIPHTPDYTLCKFCCRQILNAGITLLVLQNMLECISQTIPRVARVGVQEIQLKTKTCNRLPACCTLSSQCSCNCHRSSVSQQSHAETEKLSVILPGLGNRLMHTQTAFSDSRRPHTHCTVFSLRHLSKVHPQIRQFYLTLTGSRACCRSRTQANDSKLMC